MKRIAALLLGAALIAGVGCKMAPEAFKSSWKAGFMKTCVGSDTSEEKTQVCECVVDRLLADLTVDQLKDISYAAEYAKTKAVPDCTPQENQ